jgi:hypothetical protein
LQTALNAKLIIGIDLEAGNRRLAGDRFGEMAAKRPTVS